MKMKRFALVIAVMVIIICLGGCFDAVFKKTEVSVTELPSSTEGEVIIQAVISPEPDETKDEQLTGKNILFEIRNVSGAPYVMDDSFELDYFDDLDAITAADFTISSGNSRRHSTIAKVMADYAFTETSPTTYQLTIVCVAGALPTDEDEQYVYLEDALVSTVTISGTYNELAVIEFNGGSFLQVG